MLKIIFFIFSLLLIPSLALPTDLQPFSGTRFEVLLPAQPTMKTVEKPVESGVPATILIYVSKLNTEDNKDFCSIIIESVELKDCGFFTDEEFLNQLASQTIKNLGKESTILEINKLPFKERFNTTAKEIVLLKDDLMVIRIYIKRPYVWTITAISYKSNPASNKTIVNILKSFKIKNPKGICGNFNYTYLTD